MKQKIVTGFFLFFCLILKAQSENATAKFQQEEQITDSILVDTKHIRLGVKLGVPNIASGSLEIVLPFLNNHWALYGDYSKFKIKPEDDVQTRINYWEYGVNYYVKDRANGFYFSAGQSNLDTQLDFENRTLNNGQKGSGTARITLATQNLKLGIKSKGALYFRFEIGYGFGTFPDEVTFVATTANGQQESITEPIPDLPGVGDQGILIGNFGFGISF
jgi:hypothetical protein